MNYILHKVFADLAGFVSSVMSIQTTQYGLSIVLRPWAADTGKGPPVQTAAGDWCMKNEFNGQNTLTLIILAGAVQQLKGWITLEMDLAIGKFPFYTGDSYSWHPHNQALITSDCMVQQASSNCLVFSQLAKPQRQPVQRSAELHMCYPSLCYPPLVCPAFLSYLALISQNCPYEWTFKR